MGAQPGKTGFRILAYMSVGGLAAAGVVLPLLPTTPPFVILAAFFASKSSPPAFARWLEEHPTFGPAIEEWRARRAIPRKAKLLAFAMMGGLSWSMLVWLGSPVLVLAVSGGCFYWVLLAIC